MSRKRRSDTVSIPADVLRDLYVVQRLTDQEIADRFGCTACTIGTRRAEYGIATNRAQKGRGRLLSPAVLRREYETLGLTHEQIAAKYGMCEDTVRAHVHRAGLARQTPMTRRRQASIFADARAFALLLGACIGDGHLSVSPTGRARLELKHAASQAEWLNFKVAALAPILDFTWQHRGPSSGGFAGQEQVRAVSAAHPDLEAVHAWLYDGNTRRLPDAALDRMTPLTLSTWLLDDGSVDDGGDYVLYANRYPAEDAERAATTMARLFGLHARVRFYRPNQPVLAFARIDGPEIARMLQSEVGAVDAMRYKIWRPA